MNEDRKESHSIRLSRMPWIDNNDPKAVKKRIAEYFDLCEEDEEPPTVAGMAVAIWATRPQLYAWLDGKIRKPPEVVEWIERGRSVINALMEGRIMKGKGNVVGYIFLSKNNFEGYVDEREIVTRTKTPELTERQLIEQAKKLPGFIDAEWKEIK